MSDGFLVIDKPSGITSHDVVARVRKVFNTKRVGHAGTLDPMATGVLVLGINNGTKLLQYITEGKKRYLATIKLGAATVTDDKEGEVLKVATNSEIASVSDSAIKSYLESLVGTIMQRPSSVSAIKVDGKRAYDRVREGEVVELPAREVTIYSLEIINIARSELGIEIDIDVACSAGTYIRAIARDLGVALKVGGHLIELRRSEVAPFSLAEAVTLESVSQSNLLDIVEVAKQVLPSRVIDLLEKNELKFGRSLPASEFSGVGIAITGDNELCALIENRNSGAQPIAVFVKE